MNLRFGDIEMKLLEACIAKQKSILMIGDGMTDRYIHGHLGDCQEGCMKFVEESRIEVPGGVNNAERSLENWPIDVYCYCSSIPLKTRYVVDRKYIFRHDNDGDCTRSLEWKELLGEHLTCDAILLSDYDKGFLSPEFIRQIIDHANERDIPIVVDAKREPELYQGAIIKCNIEYANKYTEQLAGRYNTIITTGANSPLQPSTTAPWVNNQMMCWPIKVNCSPVLCINHVGAGDCFAAHMTLALAHGFSLIEAATIAHSAGRVYVQHMHNRPPHPEEIMYDMQFAESS